MQTQEFYKTYTWICKYQRKLEVRWNEELDSELWGKRLTSPMAMILFSDLCRRSDLPIMFWRECHNCDESNVVVLTANWNPQPCGVLNDSEGNFSETQWHSCLRNFFSDIVSGEADH